MSLPKATRDGHSRECWIGAHDECSHPQTCACEHPDHEQPHPNGGDQR